MVWSDIKTGKKQQLLIIFEAFISLYTEMLINVVVAFGCLVTLKVTLLLGNSINAPLTWTRINGGR